MNTKDDALIEAHAMSERLYDVFAVNIATGKERVMSAQPLTEENAEAFIKIAIARRGVDEEFYVKRDAESAA